MPLYSNTSDIKLDWTTENDPKWKYPHLSHFPSTNHTIYWPLRYNFVIILILIKIVLIISLVVSNVLKVCYKLSVGYLKNYLPPTQWFGLSAELWIKWQLIYTLALYDRRILSDVLTCYLTSRRRCSLPEHQERG